MWQSFPKVDPRHPGSLDSFLIQIAEWRIRDLFRRRSLTGQETKYRRIDPRDIRPTATMADTVAEEAEFDRVEELVDVAAAREEIRQAVHNLYPPFRDKVYRRFWLQQPVPFSGHWWHGPSGAKRTLSQQLGHLRGLV